MSSYFAATSSLEYKLPAGSQLGQLALRMLEDTLNWFTTVFKHLDSEFVRLTQVKISEEETLILLSEEVIIMFDRFYAIRRMRMDFTVHGLRVEYMVRCIWLSMEVHMVMDEFDANGMKYNSIYAFFYQGYGRECCCRGGKHCCVLGIEAQELG
jgi:hypothetical protein